MHRPPPKSTRTDTPFPHPTPFRSPLHRFPEGLPAGVQLFRLFHANPALIELMAEVRGMAPSPASQLGREPALFEGVLTHDVMRPLPAADALKIGRAHV